MEETPYLKSGLPDNQQMLDGKISSKLTYLGQIRAAVSAGDDRLVYELLDSKRYNETIRQVPEADSNRHLAHLIDDLQDELSHHLAGKLIKFLAQRFPFFYYEETQLGVFQLYFGNWWDRRHFGVLDPLTVSFIFDDDEYEKLRRAVELSDRGERYHTQIIEETTQANAALQKVVADQGKRDSERLALMESIANLDEQRGGIFGGRMTSDERRKLTDRLAQLDAIDEKALEVPKLIEKNNEQILNYSKADTILIYEQRAINDAFGDFKSFEGALSSLYADYLNHLLELDTVEATTTEVEHV